MQETAKYSPQDIARWILCNTDREAGDSITHLKLQKLVYYAQAWTLALLERPLFDEDFQAWTHGPVVVSLFREYTGFGYDALPLPDEGCPMIEEGDVQQLLDETMNIYGQHTAKYLEKLTHKEAPWLETRGDIPPEAYSQEIIKKELMAKFYKKMYDDLT